MAKKKNKDGKKNVIPEYLVIELLSDTTFSTGYETMGQVDTEVDYDNLGLPKVGGKTLHGLLRDGWLTFANKFETMDKNNLTEKVFGLEKSNKDKCILRISDALFCGDNNIEEMSLDEIENFRSWLDYYEKENENITSEKLLNLFTSIRTQNSIDHNGISSDGFLRFSRVVNSGIKLKSKLIWFEKPRKDDLRCLAISALSVRNVGLARNRGRGFVKITLNGDWELTKQLAEGK